MPIRTPLTYQQRWLWDLTQRYARWQCVVVYAFRLRGALNAALLAECFDTVIHRHASLRARIIEVDGTALMEIEDDLVCQLPCLPVPGATAEEIEANAQRVVEDLCDQKMDLTAGPFWKVRLLRLNDQEHWLALAMHRIVGDCASIDQAYREIRALYSELERGRPSPLKEPLQYTDYALRQAESADAWQMRHEPYWSKRLAGARAIEWPADPSAATTVHTTLGKVRCLFGESLSGDLREFARKSRTLAPTLMMTLYAIVLWRWSGQTDFVLPFNVAGRQSEHKSVIGYFSYVLYLRIQLTGEESFKQFLDRVGQEFFSGLSHQDFGRMAFQYPQLLSGTLFQWVTWHPDDLPVRTQEPATSATAVSSDPLKQPIDRVCVRDFGEGLTIVPPGMTAAEITFFDTANNLYAIGSYRADLFIPETMDRLMADIRLAMETFVHHPDTPIALFSARYPVAPSASPARSKPDNQPCHSR